MKLRHITGIAILCCATGSTLLLFMTLSANNTRPTPPADAHKGGQLDPGDASAALRRNISRARSPSDSTDGTARRNDCSRFSGTRAQEVPEWLVTSSCRVIIVLWCLRVPNSTALLLHGVPYCTVTGLV
jgi:hypothetical protein